MKTKHLITGLLASTMVLSVAAASSVKKVNHSEELLLSSSLAVKDYVATAKAEQELEVKTLASVVGYDAFYSKYGYEKEATVFFNGETLPFTDAFPLIERGTTFVPLVVLAERLGITTEYIPETHSVSLPYNGDVITFDIDDTKYYVNGGEAQELPFATFTVNGRTMVPLRFVTDVFGLSIYWNDQYSQVMVADLDALKADLAGNYSKMDALLEFSNHGYEGQNAQVTGDFDFDVSYEGETASFSGDLSALANGDFSALSYEMDFAMDVSPFHSKIKALMSQLSPNASDEELVDSLLDVLTEFSINYIYDLDNMMIYVQSDLVMDLFPLLSQSTLDEGIDQETWYQLSVGDFMLDSEVKAMQSMTSQFSGQSSVTSMEELVDFMMEMTRYENNNTTNIYGMLELILKNSSDDSFEVEGDSSTLSFAYKQGSKAAAFDLVLNSDEAGAVTSYEASLSHDDVESFLFTVEQESSDRLYFAVESDFGGLLLNGAGNLQVAYTEDSASKPEGDNIYDMTKAVPSF